MNRLWAVTSYFNPTGYRTKFLNYRLFRERLQVPLLTVEHSCSGSFELEPGDADILVQLDGGDVMWQKERLLNIAISRLPGECDVVAWLDCDVIFNRANWAEAAIAELDEHSLCQLYRTVFHLKSGAAVGAGVPEAAFAKHTSIGYAHSAGIRTSVYPVTTGVPNAYKRGHAWCARRDPLQKFGLYDRAILGGADAMIAFAVLRQTDEWLGRRLATPAQAADYREWSGPFGAQFNEIRYVEGDLFHLWHGDLSLRYYLERQIILMDSGYNPGTDIALDANRVWRWNSEKPEMHRRVREYFEQRREDGEADERALYGDLIS